MIMNDSLALAACRLASRSLMMALRHDSLVLHSLSSCSHTGEPRPCTANQQPCTNHTGFIATCLPSITFCCCSSSVYTGTLVSLPFGNPSCHAQAALPYHSSFHSTFVASGLYVPTAHSNVSHAFLILLLLKQRPCRWLQMLCTTTSMLTTAD